MHNKIMLIRDNQREREFSESERSETSVGFEKVIKHLACSKRDVLQVEEISVQPIRRSLIKKRSISTGQKTVSNKPQFIIKPSNKQAVPNASIQTKKAIEDSQNLINIRQTLKSRILTGIDLSIISESKNQSKLSSPQFSKPQKQNQISFSKWMKSRQPPAKKNQQLQKKTEYSNSQICELSLNPCLNSFCEDQFNESKINNQMSFQEYISKSCKLIPTTKHIQNGQPKMEKSVSRQKKNAAAKKIISIQALFAEKGVHISTKMNNFEAIAKKRIITQQIETKLKKQDSVVVFEADSIVIFEASIEDDDN